jgi:putative addiction module antidote
LTSLRSSNALAHKLPGSDTDYIVCSIGTRVEATTFALKLRKIGNSVGLVLPKEMLTRLDVKAGQLIFAVETRGGYSLAAVNPIVGKQIDAGIQLMGRHNEVFVKLAK